MLGGGHYEPIMAMIPEEDRREQIELHRNIIKKFFEIDVKGAWIAEKVWETDIVDTLLSSGINYTIIDDTHLINAGVSKDDVFGPFSIKGSNAGSLTLFPSLTKLRYTMPFQYPRCTIDFLKKEQEKSNKDLIFFFADDGEKFGLWPYTNWWVYKKKWLSEFFSLLEKNTSWIQTVKSSEVLDMGCSREIDSIPHASYEEMMEWSEGNFRNFFHRYPEADRMKRRMLSVSRMIRNSIADSRHLDSQLVEKARIELFKAQSNCAYWHGVFGGLYLPHLRDGVYQHLIKAHNILKEADKREKPTFRVINWPLGDNDNEIFLENNHLSVFVQPNYGGVIKEIDFKSKNINISNTISRTREKYHDKLLKNYSNRLKLAKKFLSKGQFVDIHELLGVKDRGLKKLLEYDDYERSSFLTRIYKNHDKPWRVAVCGKNNFNESFFYRTI